MAQTKRRKRRRRPRDRQDQATRSPEPPIRKPNLAPSPNPATWWITAAMCGLPALTAAVVYVGTLPNQLIYDDRWTMMRIPSFSIATVIDSLHRTRGLTYAVHSLDKWLWGTWSPGFHITNIILHALASALVARVAFALTSRRPVALLAGLLFAVHPVHVEVVASFSYRKDSLATIFVLLALILWIGTGRPALRYAGCVICLGLGILSKEVAAIGLVPMLFLADLLPGHGHPGKWRPRMLRAVLRFIPFLGLGIAVTVWFITNVSMDSILHHLHHESNNRLPTYHQVLATACGSIPDVARLLFFPLELSADYPTQPQSGLTAPNAIVGLALVFGWIMAGVFLARRRPVAAFAVAWTLLMYLPCSNILPLTHFFLADRYLYACSVGVCLLVALGLERAFNLALLGSRTPFRVGAATLAAVLIVAGGWRTVDRTKDWRDDLSLWSSAIQAGMETHRTLGNLGKSLFDLGRYHESIEHFARALELHPCTKQQQLLANALARAQNFDEAAFHCRVILEFDPDNRQARSLLAYISRNER